MTGEAGGARERLREYKEENRELLTRLLASGSAEARAYALAVFAEVGTDEDIEAAKRDLDALKRGDLP